MLGGNIGIPLVERLPELTPERPRRHRALGAAAADAVARDDRRGLHERHVRPPRPARLARGLPRREAAARGARRPGRRAGPERRRPGRRGLRRARDGAGHVLRLGRAARTAAWASSTAGSWTTARAGSCRSTSSRSPAATTSRTRWPPSPSGCCSASRRTRSARAAAAFTGVEHRLEQVAIVDGVRFVNDSQGTQPDAVVAALEAFEPPIVLIAGGRDKGVDLSALAPVVAERAAAAVLIGESGPDARGAVPRTPASPTPAGRTTLDEAVRAADAIARELHRRRCDPSPRPCCSARPPPASTCSWTTPPAAGRSRSRSRGSPPSDASSRGGSDERHAAGPASRTSGRPRPRTPAKPRKETLKRERHQADYTILVVVVALIAIGILMVYQLVGDEGLSPRRRHALDRRAPDRLGRARARRHGGHDAGRLPLPAPRLGAGLPRRARAARPRLRPEPERRRRRLRALAEGRAAAGRPPGRVREARDGHLPRPLVREAGDQDQGLLVRARSRSSSSSPRSSCSSSASPTSARRWSSA